MELKVNREISVFCHFFVPADNISLYLKAIPEEWGITQNMLAFATDSDANMVPALRKAGWKHPHLVNNNAIKAS